MPMEWTIKLPFADVPQTEDIEADSEAEVFAYNGQEELIMDFLAEAMAAYPELQPRVIDPNGHYLHIPPDHGNTWKPRPGHA